ncbi:hypothetical protein [Bdellovibrio sp. HCB337]|uniref:hypothetical protein n=1 Tax=Bdellovibrio sp. HCB337 TaxID=3394358 RepID=UPI0039A59A4D
MNKFLLTIVSLVANQSAFAGDVNDYIREIYRIEARVKISVTVQYQCAGQGEEAGRVGFIAFDKSKPYLNLNNVNDRTNWAKNGGRNDLTTGKLVPAAPARQPHTAEDLKVWDLLPETIKGVRTVGTENTQDMVLTFDQATTSTIENGQTFANEQVEEIKTMGTLVTVDHTTGQTQEQRCNVIIQKCDGVNCVTRVILQNYHRPFSMNSINK